MWIYSKLFVFVSDAGESFAVTIAAHQLHTN